MKNDIFLDTDEKEFWIATTEGWKKAVGQTANICGIDCSIYVSKDSPLGLCLKISDLKSGCLIRKMPVSFIDFLEADTKEKAMQLFVEKLKELANLIIENNLKNQILEKSRKELFNMIGKYGPMPEIVRYFG